ncbi:MAG: leucyl/phenylalanyl-tRNA--protein transferase [Gammaproteobacteria bacterium]|nr:leucyl/phenylalanyl-tRNA--protein transferase [Gammaproteobacteria bacterium]
MTAPYWLNPLDREDFPNVSLALRDPDGLLAIGGDLSIERLLAAYQRGIFPWYSDEQPVLWWSPDPRSIIRPENLRISRSLQKTLKKQVFQLTIDKAFKDVIKHCSESRKNAVGTWITDEMMYAYNRLHDAGHAHSIECWQNDKLVGGLYGIAIGQVFFGESMFSKVTDASKVAFVYLIKQLQAWGYELIDCQVQSAHLDSLGAENIPRTVFIHALEYYCQQPGHDTPWEFDPDLLLKTS